MFTKLVSENVLEGLAEGISALATLVKSTMGPKGRFVLLKRGDYPATATKDGVTVAEAIDLGNDIQGIGVSLVQQAARRTVDAVGDGTTASIVLAETIIDEGIKAIEKGANPVMLKRGISEAVHKASKIIEAEVMPTKDLNSLIKVATISANNDEEIGRLIGTAVHSVGEFGNVKVESGVGRDSTIEYKNGYTVPRGYESPHFINSEKTFDIRYNNAFILLLDQKVNTFDEIERACQFAATQQKPLVIIAHGYDQNVISLLGYNNREGRQFAAIQAEGVGLDRKEVLNDLAVLSGATVLPSSDIGDYQENALGVFSKVEIKKEESTFIEGQGDIESLNSLIASLKSVTAEDTDYGSYNKIKERLAKLVKGVGVLKVGAETPLELGELLDRVDDATKATRAALKHGVVLGGGLTYLKAADALRAPERENSDVRKGYDIVMSALATPIKTIADNAGANGYEVIENIMRERYSVGYNALTGEYVDFKKEGIYDPVLVSTSALKAAASVAQVILTSAGAIYNEPQAPFSPTF